MGQLTPLLPKLYTNRRIIDAQDYLYCYELVGNILWNFSKNMG